MTLGEKFKEIGLISTSWLDQETGEERRGTFDPSAKDPKTRYGNPNGLKVKDWSARNKVGAHAAGDLSQVTAEIARKVLKVDQADETQDTTDLNFVDGASALVLKLAIEQGLVVLQGPSGTQPPVVAPGNPTTPFLPATDHELLEEILVRLDKLQASLEGQKPGLDPGALARGGAALDALKALLASPEMHQATGGDKYQALKKRVLQAGTAVDQAS